jgi:AcrR family transcriptional regulator
LHNDSNISTVHAVPGYRAIFSRGKVPQTQEERKAETRARLVAAAAELFGEQGIDAVSVDAVAEAAGRTSGAVYAHFGSKQGLLLALLDSWKDSVLTVLLAEVAVTESPLGQLAAVWGNVGGSMADGPGNWSLLEQELWLRAARDDEVAAVIRTRNAEARQYTARRLAGWSSAVDAHPVAGPDDLAVLVKALLTGLAMQRRLDPESVDDDLAVRGLAALLGMTVRRDRVTDPPPRTAPPAHTAPTSQTAPTPQGATP